MPWSLDYILGRKAPKRRGLPYVIIPGALTREELAEVKKSVARPLFLPVEDWGVFHAPTMSADQYAERRAMRALDQAFIDRAHEMRARRIR
jgi:hypothetical protein